jgi:GMP synthase (glutamine-hydrolysing)
MKDLWIIKAGTTFARTARQCGDFDDWTLNILGDAAVNVRVFDVKRDEPLPSPHRCAGVVVTGSHAMVTDRLPWSRALEDWIPGLLDAHVPVLGICYGHQLLAQAMGGQVAYHPGGREMGTVAIRLRPECAADPLFQRLPASIAVHTVHAQTVLTLPPGSVPLAGNEFEPNHAFRLGESAWGVQFHPEYDEQIMRSYITELADELEASGRDVSALLAAVRDTPQARRLPARFLEIVRAYD